MITSPLQVSRLVYRHPSSSARELNIRIAYERTVSTMLCAAKKHMRRTQVMQSFHPQIGISMPIADDLDQLI